VLSPVATSCAPRRPRRRVPFGHTHHHYGLRPIVCQNSDVASSGGDLSLLCPLDPTAPTDAHRERHACVRLVCKGASIPCAPICMRTTDAIVVYCWRGAIEHTTCGARRTYVEGLANKNQAATHSTLPQSASQCLVPCMHDHDRLVLLHTKLGPKKKCVRNSTSNSHSSSKSKPRNTSHRRHLTKFF
jgi:hypothetical protein